MTAGTGSSEPSRAQEATSLLPRLMNGRVSMSWSGAYESPPEARDPVSVSWGSHRLTGLWELLLGEVRGPLCRAPLETSVTLLPTNTHTKHNGTWIYVRKRLRRNRW